MSRIIAEKTIHIHLKNYLRPLERSIEQAYDKALYEFGLDDDCHSEKVPEWDRSSCHIEIEFEKLIVTGSYVGGDTIVVFKARCHKTEDEDEEL